MSAYLHRYPKYGTAGLVLLVIMQTALWCDRLDVIPGFPWWLLTANATPVCWWGYILAVDAWIYRCKGASLLASRRQTFALMCLLSVAFWSLFEAYNRLLPGWTYINLPDHLAWRFAGYAVAFATIMPGMFLTCELLQVYRLFERVGMPAIRWTPARLRLSVVVGALFCFAPPFFPEPARGYLWALVWTGWFFLLEPFNYRRGMPSIFRDWEQGRAARTLRLFATGVICGLLWEFWNMWAHTKWIYTFPLGHGLKLFEMPLVGFPGFLPFALDCFVMFHFLASFYTRDDKLGI
jgi:hypothetical protein